jgi:hypothetical protein
MTRPDEDMAKMSQLLAYAQSIAVRRNWKNVGTGLSHAETALLAVEPHAGEKGGVRFRPLLRSRRAEPDDWF